MQEQREEGQGVQGLLAFGTVWHRSMAAWAALLEQVAEFNTPVGTPVRV